MLNTIHKHKGMRQGKRERQRLKLISQGRLSRDFSTPYGKWMTSLQEFRVVGRPRPDWAWHNVSKSVCYSLVAVKRP